MKIDEIKFEAIVVAFVGACACAVVKGLSSFDNF
jgi:hypothetical protein